MTRYVILTEKEVSEWLGIPEATLRTQRSRPSPNRKGVPWFTLPNGKPAYREDLVNAYLEELAADGASIETVKPRARKTG